MKTTKMLTDKKQKYTLIGIGELVKKELKTKVKTKSFNSKHYRLQKVCKSMLFTTAKAGVLCNDKEANYLLCHVANGKKCDYFKKVSIACVNIKTGEVMESYKSLKEARRAIIGDIAVGGLGSKKFKNK